MRSLFGALFGLVIGIFVSAILKNHQFFEIIKETLKQPSYLSLIIAFSIFGWIIGMTSLSNERIKNFCCYDKVTFLSLAALGVIVAVLTKSSWAISILYLVITTIIWVIMRKVILYYSKKEKLD